MRARIKSAIGRLGGGRLWLVAVSAGKAMDIRRGTWTEPELGLIRQLVKPGSIAVDIGANYGMWSYHLARAVGPQGKVYAFEPIPMTARASRLVLGLLGMAGRVTLTQAGAGEQAGEASFSVPITDTGTPSAQLARMTTDETDGYETLTVPIVRVGDVVPAGVSFLKVDVEGAELYALRGAHDLLARDRPAVVCEIGAGLLKERFGIDVADLVAFMTDLGYSMHQWTPAGAVPVDLTGGHDGNYLFLQPAHVDALPGAQGASAPPR